MSFYGMSDKAILREFGKRVRQRRLAKNLSQERLAKMAGVNRMTIVNLEKGKAATLLTFVQVLNALGSLDGLENLLPEPGLSPLQVAKMKGRERRRASADRKPEPDNNEVVEW